MEFASTLTQLPDDFDVSIVGDGSTLRHNILEPLRELAWRKAMTNRIWFLENFWMVIDPESMTEVPFKLRDYQLEDQEWIEESFRVPRWRGIYGKARQIGATTEIAASGTWDMMFHRNHPWVVSSQTEDDAKETLETRFKQPYLALPMWIKERGPELTNDNTESMEFDNRSRVLSVPSTSRAGRSKVVYAVVMDEAAHMENASDVFTAMNYMCYGPLYVISTGNGMGNFFHATWVDSQTHDSEWRSTFHPWFVVPNRGPVTEGIDENGNKYKTSKWYEREKRTARAEGQLWKFYQELPASPEEMFAKTGLAVLPMELLRDGQEWVDPVAKVDLTMHWQRLGDPLPEGPEGARELPPAMGPADQSFDELWIWESPTIERSDKGVATRPPNYVIFVDIAEGLEHGDRTSIVVVNANTFEQAAAYRGHWPIEDLAELVNLIGRYYHLALVMPERNNQGITVINDLRRLFAYPRMYRMTSLAAIPKGDRTPRYGWVTTKASKPKMVFDFIKALRGGHVLLHDVRLLEEAATFIRTDKDGFAASGSNYDDHVMGHLGAWQAVLEVGQYPIVWKDEGVTRPVTWGDMLEWDDNQAQEADPLAQPIGQDEPEHKSFAFLLP